ncbi:YidB family protein [Streptomyces baarnensis]|uniref:YidB family protein n=1 Tax=Streptomyces baarnensis TaxID=66872 RepID=UPI000515B3F9|nr:YidB family protein [Streptomyces baarnensis]
MAGNDLGSLLGGLLGGGQGSGQGGGQGPGGAGNILGSLLGALAGGAGGMSGGAGGGNALEGLIGVLTRSGLVDQAQSWVGTGDNKAVSGAQIAEALPDETLRKVAEDSGVSPREAAEQIARALPETVDKLTPSGQVPQGGSIEDLIKQQKL